MSVDVLVVGRCEDIECDPSEELMDWLTASPFVSPDRQIFFSPVWFPQNCNVRFLPQLAHV